MLGRDATLMQHKIAARDCVRSASKVMQKHLRCKNYGIRQDLAAQGQGLMLGSNRLHWQGQEAIHQAALVMVKNLQ